MTIKHDGLRVTWLGYATVRIETPDDFVVYLDPGRYGVLDDYHARDGDVVCVTHIHHYDSDGIEHVAKEDATVVAYGGIEADDTDRDVLPLDELPYEVVTVGQEDRAAVDDAQVWTLPAYNHEDGPHVRDDGTPYHPKGFGVGFLLSVGGRTVFWPGDSDVLEGHHELEVSLFLANIAGTVVMDRHEAADLAESLDPDLVLPVHYDTLEMLEADSAAFAADVAGRGVPVVLDERGVPGQK
ncbi:MBL fold metallo-hydrolase [Halobium salinum]|uniref:MBL fold metallo-hydrolase n=1 Tax=Halobium salinum TaxID=1364940 RepID=A0ABD5P6V7_9EURY|nr:MBL fold metallo-hydrolase [Halobium salinum]